MKRHLMKTRALLLFISLSSLIQCGPRQEEASVGFELTPDSPQVITADFEYEDNQIVTGPYFKINTIKVVNNSDKYVTIVALEFEVTARTEDEPAVKTTTLEASGSKALEVGNTTCSYNFETFDSIAPHEVAELTQTDLFPTGSTDDTTCAGKTFSPNFYVGSNPDKENDLVLNYNYKVKMTPIGWFGKADDPIKKFEKTVTFQTQ